jgi:CBS domain containing-hemolysin-like protein
MLELAVPLLATGTGTTILPGGQFVSLIIVVLSLVAVAFFSSSEASLISVNTFRIRHLAEQGNKAARSVLNVVEQHEKFFATILLTENAFIIMSSSVGTALAISVLGESALSILVATVAMTFLVVVFGEITPKSLAAKAPERWSMVVGRPVQIIMLLETPIIFGFTLLPRLIMRMFGSGWQVTPSVTEGELRMLIEIARTEGMVEQDEADRLKGGFRFGDREVRDIMTPRTEIVFIERGSTLNEFLELYSENAHTRLPVYHDSTDNVIGVLSSKDILRSLAVSGIEGGDSVTDVIRDVHFVPETKRIAELFDDLRQSGNQIAIAVDEFGGVAGLVTLKQLIEEVVGRVGEEGVGTEDEMVLVEHDTYDVDGGMSIDEVRDRIDLSIEEGDFETVAGFALEQLGHIPVQGERFESGGLTVEITRMDSFRIDRLRLTKHPKPVTVDEDD